LGDKIKKNETGGACSMYGEGRGAYRVLVWKPVERDNLKDLGVDWMILR
jgi:hypothetical protein